MRRREFIAGLGGAVAWPLASGAQQAERIRRVGMLSFGLGGPQSGRPAIMRALRDGLRSLGWTEDRNLQLDERHTSDAKAVDAYADELVSLAPEVIVTATLLATRAVQQRTRSIPIVFAGAGDPIEGGLVKSLARPEGNTTGIANLYSPIGGKWVSLLKDIVPSVARVGIVIGLIGGPPRDGPGYVSEIEAAAAALHLQAIRIPYGTAAELERAVDAFATEPNASLIVRPPGLVGIDRRWFFRLVEKHRLPTIYHERTFVQLGGLMSYGSSTADLAMQAAAYVDRILRGAKPGDLPVQFPTKFELVINLKTAKALGLTIPPNLLAIADEVIE
jgi:putative tryptophan/tyrosine transport system substrate-binding protein